MREERGELCKQGREGCDVGSGESSTRGANTFEDISLRVLCRAWRETEDGSEEECELYSSVPERPPHSPREVCQRIVTTTVSVGGAMRCDKLSAVSPTVAQTTLIYPFSASETNLQKSHCLQHI